MLEREIALMFDKKEYKKAWYKANKEKIKEKAKAYYEANKEKENSSNSKAGTRKPIKKR